MQLLGVCLQPIQALRVNDLALAIDHIIVFDDSLANVKIVALDANLRLLNRLADHAMLNSFVFRESGCLHQALDVVVGEAPHEIVIEAQEKARFPGVALPAAAATQLIVDAARFMTLRAQYKEPAGIKYHLPITLDRLFGVDEGLLPLRFAGGGEVDALPAQCCARQTFRVAA